MSKETILVVEDEADLRLILRNNLQFVGYRVLETGDGDEAAGKILGERPDLVILDVMLPGRDGFEILRDVRGQGFRAPVIFLTARAEERDRIAGLEIGADDYVTKPFSVGELLARVKAILRRSGAAASASTDRRTFGELVIDLERYAVERDGQKTSLGFFEAEILRVLLETPGEAVSRARILDEVWGGDAFPTTRAVDNHILSLRKKIEPDPANPRHIQTAHRVGYRFVP